MSEKSDEKSYRVTVPLAFHISIYFSQTTDPIRTKLDRKKNIGPYGKMKHFLQIIQNLLH